MKSRVDWKLWLHPLFFFLTANVPFAASQDTASTSESTANELSILQQLYEATDGSSWRYKDGWTVKPDVCAWRGIECWSDTTYQGRVRRIRLPNNRLKGSIPASIFNLTYLTTLDVSHNDVSLNFTYIRTAPSLHSLNMAATNTPTLTGISKAHSFLNYLYADRLRLDNHQIPDEIWNMKQLKVLSLAECQLEGTISDKVGGMQNLEELYLYSNKLHGTLPEAIGSLINLRRVSLARNQLYGTLPDALHNLTNLEAISVMDQISQNPSESVLSSFNQSTMPTAGFTGPLRDFATMPYLTMLVLAKNRLDGTIPDTLLESVQILNGSVTIDLSDNRFIGTIPVSLGQRMDRLSIFLNGNDISDIDPTLCNNAQADWMDGNVADFACNAILCPPDTFTVSGGGRQVYADQPCRSCSSSSTSSDDLSLSYSSSFYGQEQCGDGNPMEAERYILRQLYHQCNGKNWKKQWNWLDETRPVCDWYGISCNDQNSTTSISLGDNRLEGVVPTILYTLPHLEKLSIFANNVNISFQGLEHAVKLKTLSMDAVPGLASLNGIGKAPNLEILSVRSAGISGSLPVDLSRLNQLKSLILSNNRLSGQLPSWLSSMTSLVSLSLANNTLHGPLYDFAELSHLQYLDVSYNQITGTLPSSLLKSSRTTTGGDETSGSADPKEFVVDFSHNLLQGTIPMDWTNGLTALTIHLQDNRLTGISSDLCSKAPTWNDGDVGMYGCDGLLCPIGSSNSAGRQTSPNRPCVSCGSVSSTYMGSTICGDATANSESTSDSSYRLLTWKPYVVWTAVTTAFLLVSTFDA